MWTDKPPTEDGVYKWRENETGMEFALTVQGKWIPWACADINSEDWNARRLREGQWLGPLALVDPDELAELRRKAEAWDGWFATVDDMAETVGDSLIRAGIVPPTKSQETPCK